MIRMCYRSGFLQQKNKVYVLSGGAMRQTSLTGGVGAIYRKSYSRTLLVVYVYVAAMYTLPFMDLPAATTSTLTVFIRV